jgi:hypothetical protein
VSTGIGSTTAGRSADSVTGRSWCPPELVLQQLADQLSQTQLWLHDLGILNKNVYSYVSAKSFKFIFFSFTSEK